MNELRGDCRLERVNLRHKEVRKHVRQRNIVINTSRRFVIMQQFSNGLHADPTNLDSADPTLPHAILPNITLADPYHTTHILPYRTKRTRVFSFKRAAVLRSAAICRRQRVFVWSSDP